MVGAVLVLLGLLGSRGSLDDFVSQCLTGPAGQYLGLAQWWRLFLGLALVPALVATYLCALLVLVRRSRWSLREGAVIGLDLVLVALIVVWASRVIGWGSYPVTQFWVTIAPPMSALLVFRSWWPTPLRLSVGVPESHTRIQMAILGAGGIAAWAQFVPLGDPGHIWWAAPLPLAALAVLVVELATRRGLQVIGSAAAFTIAFCAVLYHDELTDVRVAIRGGALDGMLVREEYADDFHQLQSFLDRRDLASADVLSEDGIFAVWNGKYTASDGAFVTWASGVHDRAPARESVLYCERDEMPIDQWAAARGGVVEERTGRLDLGGGPWFRFSNLWQSCAWIDQVERSGK